MSTRAIPYILAVFVSIALIFPATAMAEQDSQPADSYQSGTTEDAYYQDDIDVDMPAPAWTILNYSLSGAAVGGIVGTGLWLLSGRDLSAWLIPQFAAGGLVIGAGVGALVVLGQDREPMAVTPVEEGDMPTSVQWIERDLPRSFDVPVLQVNF